MFAIEVASGMLQTPSERLESTQSSVALTVRLAIAT